MAQEQPTEGKPSSNNPAEPSAEEQARQAAIDGGVTVNGQPAGGQQETPSEEPKDEPKERPEHIPEKFWNAETGEVDYEAMAKSYSELEAKMSGKETPEEESEEGPEEESEETPAENVVTESLSKAEAEYAEKGELTEETIESLEKAGVSRATIETYVAGVQALQEKMANDAYNLVGGEQQYQAMVQWAAANLSEKEQAAFDEAVMNPNTMSLAIRGLNAQYQADSGNEGKGVDTGKPSSESGAMTGFGSKAEMLQAMSDPKYKSDSKFREEVQQRIALSRKQGVNLYM